MQDQLLALLNAVELPQLEERAVCKALTVVIEQRGSVAVRTVGAPSGAQVMCV